MRESDIVYENPTHWVLRVAKGWEIYRIGVTCSTRCATIGRGIPVSRAIEEADKRHARAVADVKTSPIWG